MIGKPFGPEGKGRPSGQLFAGAAFENKLGSMLQLNALTT